ncbi:hypothetical protein ACWDSF_36070, partial [Nocardia beijingensis]
MPQIPIPSRPAHPTTTFERSETEHAPFAARLASEWPPRPRRSRQRWSLVGLFLEKLSKDVVKFE